MVQQVDCHLSPISDYMHANVNADVHAHTHTHKQVCMLSLSLSLAPVGLLSDLREVSKRTLFIEEVHKSIALFHVAVPQYENRVSYGNFLYTNR